MSVPTKKILTNRIQRKSQTKPIVITSASREEMIQALKNKNELFDFQKKLIENLANGKTSNFIKIGLGKNTTKQ